MITLANNPLDSHSILISHSNHNNRGNRMKASISGWIPNQTWLRLIRLNSSFLPLPIIEEEAIMLTRYPLITMVSHSLTSNKVNIRREIHIYSSLTINFLVSLSPLNKRRRNLIMKRKTEFHALRKALNKMISAAPTSNLQPGTTMIYRWRWVLLLSKQLNKLIQ